MKNCIDLNLGESLVYLPPFISQIQDLSIERILIFVFDGMKVKTCQTIVNTIPQPLRHISVTQHIYRRPKRLKAPPVSFAANKDQGT